jgi:hypothetical protein
MTALSQALEASQNKAVAALGKAYIRRDEAPDDELFDGLLKKIGLDDEVYIGFLLSAWAILRDLREQPPGEQEPLVASPELATQAQRDFIDKLMDDAGHVRFDRSDLARIHKPRASELIAELKAGTYDPSKWDVGF